MGMNGAAAQFRGKVSVMRAYENQETPAFSISWGKQFLFSYSGNSMEEGKQLLGQWLDLVTADNPDATATYTLKVYDDLKKDEKIKPSTDYSASFNFKLIDYGGYGELGIPRRGETMQRVEALENKFDAFLEKMNAEDEGEDEKPGMGSIAGMIQGLFEVPEIKQAIAGKLVQLFDNIFKVQPMTQPIGQIAGVGEVAETIPPPPGEMDEIKLTRLNNALGRLYNSDPDLIEHLEYLATMSEKEPQKFALLLTMLK